MVEKRVQKKNYTSKSSAVKSTAVLSTKIKKTKKSAQQKAKKSSSKLKSVKIAITIGKGSKSPYVINLKQPTLNTLDPFSTLSHVDNRVLNENSIPEPPKFKKVKPSAKKINLVQKSFIKSDEFIETATTAVKNITNKLFLVKSYPIYKKQEDAENDKSEFEDVFAPPNYVDLGHLRIPKNWQRKVSAFVAASLLLVLPLQASSYFNELQTTKDKILYLTNEAVKELQSGQQSVSEFDLAAAEQRFNNAKVSFASAQREVDSMNALMSELLKIIPGKGKTVTAGMQLLEAGQLIAESGEILLNGGEAVISGSGVGQYFESVKSFRGSLEQSIEKFNHAKAIIETIEPGDLPQEHQQTFNQVLRYLPAIEEGLSDAYLLNDTLLKILGEDNWQRYLVIFLNNNELRATGGFMGSFALVDIDRGNIKNMEIPGGGTYDIQGQLQARVAAPEPLQLLKARWEFQDSNWWPDYPTSAKKSAWFYKNASGTSVDGVITITSKFMEDLLSIYGPIEMPEYGRVITAENFESETQQIVEVEYDKEENKPKKFLGDMAPKLMDKIFSSNQDQMKQLVDIVKKSMAEKHVLLYFTNTRSQNVIQDIGWSGSLLQTEGDFLSIVHTNLAGGKTDEVIDEEISHTAEVQEDGSIINTVLLTRHHRGVEGENQFTGVQNNSYVRFYVPAGSEFISAQGFEKPDSDHFEKITTDLAEDEDLKKIELNKRKDQESGTDIYEENGKTVFGNWLQLKPGQSQQAIVTYRLPLRLVSDGSRMYYSLLVQKQHGSKGSTLHSKLILSPAYSVFAKYPSTLEQQEATVLFETILLTDQYYGVVLTN